MRLYERIMTTLDEFQERSGGPGIESAGVTDNLLSTLRTDGYRIGTKAALTPQVVEQMDLIMRGNDNLNSRLDQLVAFLDRYGIELVQCER